MFVIVTITFFVREW